MTLTPRPHQQLALEQTLKALKTEDRVQVLMACGTGKTLIGLWLSEKRKAKTTVVFVPSLFLVKQLLEEYRQHATGKWEALAVCSDKTVAGSDDLADLGEIPCQVTTNDSTVKDFMRRRGAKIVFCTYQSAELLEGQKFDLGIFDEAHKTSGRRSSPYGFALHDENVEIKKRVFFTATPRISRFGKKEWEKIFSMDNEELYGKPSYEYPFRQAANDGVICDYRILISDVTETIRTGPVEALRIAVQHSMNDRKMKKVFTFHNTVEKARQFVSDHKGFDPDVKLLHINGAMSAKERAEVMETFRKAKRAVLSNAKCLTEGVDVPVVDMVVFADPKDSLIEVVQATGRAVRKVNGGGKHVGYVFLPVYRNLADKETPEDAISRTGFDGVIGTVRALADQDSVLRATLFDFGRGSSGPGPGPTPLEIVSRAGEGEFSRMREVIRTSLFDAISNRREWWLQELAKFCRESGKGSPGKAGSSALGRWAKRFRQDKENGTLSAEEERILSGSGFNFNTRGENTILELKKRLDEGIAFAERHGFQPKHMHLTIGGTRVRRLSPEAQELVASSRIHSFKTHKCAQYTPEEWKRLPVFTEFVNFLAEKRRGNITSFDKRRHGLEKRLAKACSSPWPAYAEFKDELKSLGFDADAYAAGRRGFKAERALDRIKEYIKVHGDLPPYGHEDYHAARRAVKNGLIKITISI